MLALALHGEKCEEFVFLYGAANGSTKPLPRVRRIRMNKGMVRGIRKHLVRIKRLVTEITEGRTMVIVRSGFRDYVNRGACRTSVDRREALRGDLEFLHCFCGNLHDRPTHRVVFIVDAVDGGVYVAAALAVHRQDRVAVLRRIVRIGSLYTRGEIRKIGDITTDQRQLS